MVLLLVFMQLTRDLFAIAKFLLCYAADKQTNKQTVSNVLLTPTDIVGVGNNTKARFPLPELAARVNGPS